MKVLQVVASDRFAGVEAHVAALAPALARAGVDVTVVGGAPERMTALLDGVPFVPAAGRADVLRALAAVRSRDVDLIHVHMTDSELAALLTWPRHRAARVSTRHFAQVRGAGRLRALPYRLLDRQAAQVSVSRAVADAVGTDSTVIHPGVADIRPPGDRDPDRDRDRVILMAQRLDAEKDTVTGLHAFTRSGLAREGWRLRIAGGGAQEALLRQIAARSDAADAIEFLGHRDDARELMATASIFLATSPLEHFGISVVEAMAGATPVVATAGAGHLETVGHTSPQWLFDPHDAAAAATLLRRLAGDAALRAATGAVLREDYCARFTVQECARRHLALYRRVLA